MTTDWLRIVLTWTFMYASLSLLKDVLTREGAIIMFLGIVVVMAYQPGEVDDTA